MRKITMRARLSLIVAASALGIALGIGGLSKPAAADTYRVLVGHGGYYGYQYRHPGHRYRARWHRFRSHRYWHGRPRHVWRGRHRGWGYHAPRFRHRHGPVFRHQQGRSGHGAAMRTGAPRNGRGGNRGRR